MRPPIDAPGIAARIEAGEDLSPADEAAWLAYLEQNPAAAVELDEQLGQLRRLAPGADREPPAIGEAEWSSLFERITAEASGPGEPEDGAPKEETSAEAAPEDSPAPAPLSSVPAPPGLPAGGLFMTALLLITAGLIAFQLQQQAPPLPSGPLSTPKTRDAPKTADAPLIGPLPEDDAGPDIEIEDLQVGEDIQATLRLPLKRGSFTLIRLRKKPR